jgi:methylated-DNA-[protein]-cysteine S-methyltransferase
MVSYNMHIDGVKHLYHDMKQLSSIKETKEKKKEKETKLHLSSPMVMIPDKATPKIGANKPIRNSDVYDLLLKIPPGKVSTYGDLARALGNPSASRAIGRILGENPNPIKVPCHRVVMSNGRVGGYAYGAAKKRQLLENEGVSFTNGIVQNFNNVRVYPRSSKNRD